jgi:hypothetical protein
LFVVVSFNVEGDVGCSLDFDSVKHDVSFQEKLAGMSTLMTTLNPNALHCCNAFGVRVLVLAMIASAFALSHTG